MQTVGIDICTHEIDIVGGMELRVKSLSTLIKKQTICASDKYLNTNKFTVIQEGRENILSTRI